MSTGNPIQGRLAGFLANGLICLTLLIFFSSYFVDLANELFFVVTLLSVFATAILVLRYKQLLLYGVSLLVPISFPFAFAGDSVISIPAEMMCVLLTGFFFVKLFTGTKINKQFLSHPLTVLILCDLGWLLISSCFSEMPAVSFKRLIIRTCYYVTFYYFYFELFKADLGNIKKVFTLHTLGFLVPITWAMFNHAGLGFTTVGSQRISAPFYFDHTIYGACLVFFIPFLAHYAISPGSKNEKILYTCLLLIFSIAAVLSYSRAAWLSLLIAGGFYLVLKYRIRGRYLFYAACLIAMSSVFNWQKIVTSLRENKEISHSNNVGMHLKSISNINTDASNKERINRWKCALRMFADKPLTGFGPGTYQFFYGEYQQREDMTRISTYDGTKGHAHSEYLNYLSETGFPGLLIFLLIIFFASARAIGVFKKSGAEQKHVAIFVLTGLITFFIHGLFNGFLEFDKMAMPVFSSLAAITWLDLSKPAGDGL